MSILEFMWTDKIGICNGMVIPNTSSRYGGMMLTPVGAVKTDNNLQLINN